MDINALLMDEMDNVATCVAEVLKGGQAVYRKGGEVLAGTAPGGNPPPPKNAPEGNVPGPDGLKKRGVIGRATVSIARGGWVSHENIVSVPRDYEQEMV